VLVAAIVVVSCSRSEDPRAGAKAKAPAPIEVVEGMKYYVGGPVLDHDKYGRVRLAGFNGEVSNPTTRGLLIGFKQNEDRTFDYRTWLNGEIISQSHGFLDSDGLLWYSDRLNFDANGDVVVRQTFKYDDEKQIMHATLEHIDPADGHVVKTATQEIPYAPTPEELEDADDSHGEGEIAVPNDGGSDDE
jgi:hypothetical protein